MRDYLGQELNIGDTVALEKYTGYKGICLGHIIGFTKQKAKCYKVATIEIAKNFNVSDLIQMDQFYVKKNMKYKFPQLLIKINVDTLEDNS